MAKSMAKPTVVHYLHQELKIHHDFIYNQIVHARKYRPLVIGPFKRKRAKRFPFPFYSMSEIKHDGKFFARNHVKAIHAHHGRDGVQILPFARKHHIPLIVHLRGRDGSAAKGARKRNRKRYKKLKKQGAMFITVSKSLARDVKKLGFPAQKVFVLHGGIDLQKFRFQKRSLPKKGEIRILSVGRLVPKKGHETLIKAFKKVHQIHPRTTLHIIGNGRQKKHLKKLIKKYRLQRMVKLRGKMSHDNIMKEMNKAHLFCLASQTTESGDVEGIPNAIKEAMASGLPVVSTYNGGIPELVQHKKSGYLVPEKKVKKLATGLRFFLEHPRVWERYTKQARKRIEKRFDLQKQVAVQEKLYDRLSR